MLAKHTARSESIQRWFKASGSLTVPERGGEYLWRVEKDDGERASYSELSGRAQSRLQRQQVHSTYQNHVHQHSHNYTTFCSVLILPAILQFC